MCPVPGIVVKYDLLNIFTGTILKKLPAWGSSSFFTPSQEEDSTIRFYCLIKLFIVVVLWSGSLSPSLCQPDAGSIVLVRHHRSGHKKNNKSFSGRGTHWSIYQKWVSESFEWVNVLKYLLTAPRTQPPSQLLLVLAIVACSLVAVLCGNQEKLFPQDQVPRRIGWGYIKKNRIFCSSSLKFAFKFIASLHCLFLHSYLRPTVRHEDSSGCCGGCRGIYARTHPPWQQSQKPLQNNFVGWVNPEARISLYQWKVL